MKTTFTTQRNAASTLNGSHSTHNVYSPLRRLTLLVTLLMTFALGARAQATITEGVYLIKCYTAQDLYLKPVSNTANSYLTVSRTKSGDMLWRVEAVDNNRYRIQHVATGLYIYRNVDVGANGANQSVQLRATNNNNRNYFYFYTNNNYPNAYAIAPNNYTNYSFNIWGGRAEGNTIGLYTHPDGGHSMWMLENPKVPTPVITIDGDGYATISCALAGVTFRYTINGDTPTVTSAVYDGNNKPKLNDGDRIRVLGTLQGYDDSDEASMVANVVAPVPIITIADDGTVSIASTLADAVIYYTVDGEAPTETSTVYHAPFKVEDKTLVRAIAVKSGYQSSPVASRYYSTSTVVLQGNGTEVSPYLIASMDEWIAFANQANANPTQKYHVRLAGDISGYNVPVDRFTGVLDGQYHIVSGLVAPLFASTDGATIKNVVLDDVSIAASGNVGAIVGTASGATRIYNCGVRATHGSSISGSAYTGSIVGHLQAASRVINCYSFADITGGTTVGGIVGYNSTASTAGNLQTMVMNCMFYGDITGGTKVYPIYGGEKISNIGNSGDNNGLNNYNYFRHEADITPTAYNCALAAEEPYLTRFEFYRHVLNSQRRLCAYYVTGNFSDTAQIGKWVLDTEVAAYPIVKSWGEYPSMINREPVNSLGTLTVNISGSNATGEAVSKTLSLPVTDINPETHDYNYCKVQLPYYNEFFDDNYTNNKVVTGWKIVDVGGVTISDITTTDDNRYNFADRSSKGKDVGRILAQGGFFNVPEEVMSITIEPYWGKAVYLSDKYYDVMYNGSSGYGLGDGMKQEGTFATPSEYKNQTVYNTLTGSMVWNLLDAKGTVYDNAIVLVGNYHSYDENSVWSAGGKSFTIMSVDDNRDKEPDYGLYCKTQLRLQIDPVRFDFINHVGIGMAAKQDGTTIMPSLAIFRPKGWFEITETALAIYEEFEYDWHNTDKTVAPLILNGGVYNQFCSLLVDGNDVYTANRTSYVIVGGNAYMKAYTPGSQSGEISTTHFPPVSILGGEYEEFYLSGVNPNSTPPTGYNALCYGNGGKIGVFAGACQEAIDGDVIIKLDHMQIEEFYGGGINDKRPITGNIDVTLNNSKVDVYCGGPKFGNMAEKKTITTNATGSIFGVFYGAGYGGTSLFQNKNIDEQNHETYPTEWFDNYFSADRGKYYKSGADDRGIMTSYKTEHFCYAGGGNANARFYTLYASLSLAMTGNVTSTLNNCIVNGDLYGGGCQGMVTGDINTALNNCQIGGSAFAAGFSASIPTCEVMPTTKPTFSTYNTNTGIFTPIKYPASQTYTWAKATAPLEHNQKYIDDDKKEIYTYLIDLNELGTVAGNTKITVSGDSKIGGSVYGGGDESKVTDGETTVNIDGDGVVIKGSVFGGGNRALVEGNTNVYIKRGTVNQNVYGAGNQAKVTGKTNVVIGQ